VQSLIQAGQLVPDSTILELISQEFMAKGWITPLAGPTIASSFAPSAASNSLHPLSSSASFILDGFPRTATQAASLDGIIPINFAVHLQTPPSVIISRIASRWVHAPSGRVYNTEFNPPKISGKDDVTGEPLIQREDDSIETWKERLRKFKETSQSLLDHYEKRGCLWRVEGNSSDEISPKLFAEIERRFA
jgi:adenylate kinase